MVGKVLIVDVKIKAELEIKATMYSHHHCFSNIKPGIIIASFVEKEKNSIVFTLFQYDFANNDFPTNKISFGFIFCS
jgi:hypothetical protein